MNPILDRWNRADAPSAIKSLLDCCAARRWAARLASARPFSSVDALIAASDKAWLEMIEPDWLEAFVAHPPIGEKKPPHASAQSSAWSDQEQQQTHQAAENTLRLLHENNRKYKDKFGFTFVVCATGKPAEEMLAILDRRLENTRQQELREAAEQQRQITNIRLRKWMMQ